MPATLEKYIVYIHVTNYFQKVGKEVISVEKRLETQTSTLPGYICLKPAKMV